MLTLPTAPTADERKPITQSSAQARAKRRQQIAARLGRVSGAVSAGAPAGVPATHNRRRTDIDVPFVSENLSPYEPGNTTTHNRMQWEITVYDGATDTGMRLMLWARDVTELFAVVARDLPGVELGGYRPVTVEGAAV